jgi:hypothetical protein
MIDNSVLVDDLDRVLDGHDVRDAASLLMWPIIEAIVVVLPVPVGPVTRIRPRGRVGELAHHGGSRSSSNVGISERTRRIARPTRPRWR